MLTNMQRSAAIALASMVTGCTADVRQPEASTPAIHAGSYAVAPPCGPTPVGSLRELLPNDTLFAAFEVDVGAMQRSPLFTDHQATLERGAKDALDAMKACGLPLSDVERVTGGFGDGDELVLGVRASGIGEPKTLDCLARALEKTTGTAPWSRTTHGCTTTLDVDGGGKGFAVGKDMLVITTKGLAGGVERRLGGKGKALLDGRLSWARREVDLTTTTWMAADVPAAAAGALGPSMRGVSRVGLSLDASRGLGVKVSAGFASAADAKAARAELDSLAAQAGMMLPLLGLSSGVADTLRVDGKGTTLSVSMFLSRSDVKALREMAEGGSAPGAEAKPRRRGM